MQIVLEVLPLALALMVIGGLAGVVAGLLGVGGGIVLVPAFFYTFTALGYGGPGVMQVCLATSLATIIVTSLRSVLSHHKKSAVDWQVLRSWAPGIVVGAIVGVLVASNLQSVVLQGIFGALGIIIALYFWLGTVDWQLAPDMPTGVVRAGLSGVVGFLSVLMGIGGGSFGVPIMTLCGRPIHRAVATAAGFGVIIALPSAFGFLLSVADNPPPFTIGSVNVPAFALVISMTLLTTPLGVRLAHATNPKPLRRTFAIFLALVALNMLRQALGW